MGNVVSKNDALDDYDLIFGVSLGVKKKKGQRLNTSDLFF